MNTRSLAAAALIAAELAGCASPQSRVRKHQAEFDAYPAAVQQKILAGQVDVGFTARQAALALGRPDRIYTRKSAAADQEIWAYGGGAEPRVGIGLGFGMGPGPAGAGFYGGGVGIDPDPGMARDDRLRVVLQNGVVVSVESRRR